MKPGSIRVTAQYFRPRSFLKTWGGESLLRGLADHYGADAVRALSGEALALLRGTLRSNFLIAV